MFRRLLCVLLSLMLLAGMTAALAEEPAAEVPATEAETADAQVPAEEEKAPVLLATVNGHQIMDDDFGIHYYLDYYMNMMAQYGLTPDYEDYQYYYDYYLRTGLGGAVEHVFFQEKADELSLKPSAEERAEYEKTLQEDWKSAVDSYVENAGITAEASEAERKTAEEDALAYFKEQYGYTEESFVEDGLKEYDYFSFYTPVNEELTKDVTVTEEELKAYFDELVKEDEASYGQSVASYEMAQYQGQRIYYVPEGFRGVTHILLKIDDELLNNYQELTSCYAAEQEKTNAAEVPEETPEGTETADISEDAEPTPEPTATPEPVTQEMIDEAKKAVFDSVREKIDEIIDKFKAGTPFEELIAEYGEDPGMKQEDNLKNGYVIHADSIIYDPVFTEAAAAIPNIGEISEPVLGSSGIHIIYYLRDVPSGAIEMTDNIRSELNETLLEENKNAKMAELIEAWEKASTIEYTAEGQAIIDAADAAHAYLAGQAADTDQSAEEEPATEAEPAAEAAPVEQP